VSVSDAETAPRGTDLFSDASKRAFVMRKLHSLSGVFVGGYMVFHLWTNARAVKSEENFQHAVGEISSLPYLPLVEWSLILLPLLFHAVYGLKIALEGKNNVGRYPTTRNWMYTLQRVTGVAALLFIGFHLYEYWGQKLVGKLSHTQFYAALSANLSSTQGGVPLTALVYMLGIAACSFHFANGLWGFSMGWGITVSRRSQQTAATVFSLLGVALFLLGANTVLHFATGAAFPGRLFGGGEPEPAVAPPPRLEQRPKR